MACLAESQAVDHLSSLSEEEAAAWLESVRRRAAARRGGDVAGGAAEAGAGPRRLCGAVDCSGAGGCSCAPAARSEAAAPEPPARPPPTAAAADAPGARAAALELMRALEAGDWERAGGLRAEADWAHLGEAGWGCLHWAVHAAGAALRPAAGAPAGAEEEAPAGCAAACCGAGATAGSRPFLRELLEGGAAGPAVDARSADGATPLMFAADAGDAEACRLLLAARADPAVRDGDGDTAAAWARARRHAELAEYLSGLEGGAARSGAGTA